MKGREPKQTENGEDSLEQKVCLELDVLDLEDETEWMLGGQDPTQPTKELEETKGQLYVCFSDV